MKFFKEYRRKKKNKANAVETARLRSVIQGYHLQDLALNATESGVKRNEGLPIVVSLTTFSKRINDVHLTIESLFQQSHKADKIVLWLSREDFSPANIPAALKRQCERGLEIQYCERDLGPYTKFYYNLQLYPDCLMLTVDDDVMYPMDLVDQLYRAFLADPKIIHCHRSHQIKFDNQGQLLPYKQWQFGSGGYEASRFVFPTGVGGVLYFPGCFDEEIMNRDAFTRLAPKADDVWLKAMSLKKGTLCQTVMDEREWASRFVVISGSQKFSLKRRNKNATAGNDAQIRAVFDEYGLWSKLLEN